MKTSKKKILVLSFLCMVITAIIITGIYATTLLNEYKENIISDKVLYIQPGTSFETIKDSIRPYVKDMKSFEKTASEKELPKLFKPGRYLLKAQMRNKDIVRMIIKGWQKPIMLTLSGNIRGKEKLSAILGNKLAADSANFIKLFNDSSIWEHYGLTEETFISLFIPNSYEVYWTMSPEQFIQRMAVENKRFWTPEREAKAKNLELSKEEVSTLASIVCEESNYSPEMPAIAGVYINRLKKEMKLDADPTVKYAWNDPSIKRILFKHLEINSPYNTYKRQGLPPGPITIPSITGIDAVLNYEHHTYLYFCASATLDGTHKFATTLGEHNKNAREYQKIISSIKN